MKNIIALLAFLLLLSCGQNKVEKDESASNASDSDKLNILLLVGDDIAFGDLGVYASEIETPNFSRLADAGVRY